MFRVVVYSYHFETEDYFTIKAFDVVDYNLFDNREDAYSYGVDYMNRDPKYSFNIQEE